jgi:hypothetical protein
MTIPATVGDPVLLVEAMPDGNTGVYPQAEIYLPSGTVPVAVVDLNHQVKGRYEGSWIPSSAGAYSALFIVYADAAHTVESIVYTREAEQIFVSVADVDDLAAMLVRVLGLVHENVFIDNTTYDPNCMLLTARLRLFATKADAQAATDGGSEPAAQTYTVDASYEGPGRMRQYRMVKD